MKLLAPLHSKIEEWKRITSQMDRDHEKGVCAGVCVCLHSTPVGVILWLVAHIVTVTGYRNGRLSPVFVVSVFHSTRPGVVYSIADATHAKVNLLGVESEVNL